MATTEEAAGAAAEAAGVFPPFDASTYPSQLLWLAIAFGLTYYVISKIAGPRISGILEDRHDRIASDLAEAERLKRETDDAIAAYESALAEARSNANALAAETREKLTAETTAKRQASEEELAQKLADSETRIEAIKAEALGEVDTIATEAAQAIMGKLSSKAPTKAALEKAIAEAGKA